MIAWALLATSLLAVQAADVPAVAFSHLVPEKVLATARQLKAHPASYPHISNKATPSQWAWEKADWWTSGFFPATLYALNTRASLCPSSASIDIANWLYEGQSASSALIPLTNGNGQVRCSMYRSGPVTQMFLWDVRVTIKASSVSPLSTSLRCTPLYHSCSLSG